MIRSIGGCLATVSLMLLPVVPAEAQITTIDPNTAATRAQPASATPTASSNANAENWPAEPPPPGEDAPAAPAPGQSAPPASANPTAASPAAAASGATYQKNDVLSAAENTFGKGAEGLAKMIENILRDQGEPTAYISGREAGGAIAIGLRYGSGTLSHKVEGDMPIYWTGPSLGFDIGANGAKTFVLIYNLHDTADLYRAFPSAEGNVYVVGGFTASYLRRGDIVVIPIRLGVGWRLGANVGYMRFTQKSRILPF
jgi:hypothetical protein